VTDSTISGNTALVGGAVNNFGILTLDRTLIAGNTAPIAPKISNFAEVFADNHNHFGADGTAGVVGFNPDLADVVPPAGVQLSDILDPTLALHGGLTQTHALVPGSPAIGGGPRMSRHAGRPASHRPARPAACRRWRWERHRRHVIQELLANGAAPRMHRERLPAYAPEPNPDKELWAHSTVSSCATSVATISRICAANSAMP